MISSFKSQAVLLSIRIAARLTENLHSSRTFHPGNLGWGFLLPVYFYFQTDIFMSSRLVCVVGSPYESQRKCVFQITLQWRCGAARAVIETMALLSRTEPTCLFFRNWILLHSIGLIADA